MKCCNQSISKQYWLTFSENVAQGKAGTVLYSKLRVGPKINLLESDKVKFQPSVWLNNRTDKTLKGTSTDCGLRRQLIQV